MVVHYLACGSCPAYSLETFGECVYPQKFWLRGMGSGHVSASVCIFLVLGMMSPVCGYDENHVPHLEGTCSSWAALRSYQCQDTAHLHLPCAQDMSCLPSTTTPSSMRARSSCCYLNNTPCWHIFTSAVPSLTLSIIEHKKKGLHGLSSPGMGTNSKELYHFMCLERSRATAQMPCIRVRNL